jgi:hypothetical protein
MLLIRTPALHGFVVCPLHVESDWLLVMCLAISLAGNLYSFGYHSALTTQPPQRAPRPNGPTVGMTLPILTGMRVDGSPVVQNYSDQRDILLYYWSPTCVWCSRNAENMRVLVPAIRPRYAFVAPTSLPASTEDAERMGLPPDAVLSSVPRDFLREAQLNVTPQLLLVERGGTIKKVWTGALSGRALAEVEEVLHAKLPGITR